MTESQSQQTSGSKVLTLQNIGLIDRGRVALAVNHELRHATYDILDRPGDKTARKVILVIEFRPELDKQTGALDTVLTQFVVKRSLPIRRSVPYPMLATTDGRQLFVPSSPQDPRQSVFSFTEPVQTAPIPGETGPQDPGEEEGSGEEPEVSPM